MALTIHIQHHHNQRHHRTPEQCGHRYRVGIQIEIRFPPSIESISCTASRWWRRLTFFFPNTPKMLTSDTQDAHIENGTPHTATRPLQSRFEVSVSVKLPLRLTYGLRICKINALENKCIFSYKYWKIHMCFTCLWKLYGWLYNCFLYSTIYIIYHSTHIFLKKFIFEH